MKRAIFQSGRSVFSCKMFIEVCDDVLRKALKSSDKDNEQAIETLHQLSWAIRRNHHLVYFPSLTQNDIDNLNGLLNQRDTAAIRHSYSKKRDLKGMLNLVKIHVELSFEFPTQRTDDVIKINPKEAGQFELFEECHLLTENLLDAEFYKYVALSFLKDNRIDECVFNMAYYPLQGGGVTTKQVFLMECELDQHLCLAILDSDKKWPNFNGYGQTASVFVNSYKDHKKKKGIPLASHYYVMDNTNEIENLIPIEVLKHFSSKDQKAFLTAHFSVMPWFDIKKGLEYQLLYEKDEAFREWKGVLPKVMNWTKLEAEKAKSIDAQEFDNRIKKAGFKPVVQPWGTSILDNVLHPDTKHKNKYDLKKIDLDRLLQEQQQEWKAIGGLIFDWCCCFTKKLY